MLELWAWVTEEVGLREDYVGGVVEKDWLSGAMCDGLCVGGVLKKLVVMLKGHEGDETWIS